MHIIQSRATALFARLSLVLLALSLAAFLLGPAVVSAADAGPGTVESRGSGSSGSDDNDDRSGSGSGSFDDSDDDDRSDSSGDDGSSDDDDDHADDSGSSSSGSNGGGNSVGSSDDSRSASTRQRIEGKTRALINGFQAEFSIRREVRFDREKFRAEASNLNLDAGTRLAVCFDGSSLGDIVLNSLNRGELELDSRRGQAIPDFGGGETVDLRQGSCGGDLILSASFDSATGGQASSEVNDRSRIEGKARRLINGFEAEFSVRLERRPDRDKFRAEAESLNLGAGTRLDVCFEGGFLGDISLNSLNYGELELDSRLGHSFPIFENGDTVELRQGGCGGELLMAATFGGETTIAGTPGGGGNGGGGDPTGGARIEIEGKSRLLIQDFEAEFSVRFEQRPDREKIRAEVSNLNFDAGTTLTVCFEGSALGGVRLNTFHFAELELDSRLGHTVPVLQIGDVVTLHEGSSCASGSALIAATLGSGN